MSEHCSYCDQELQYGVDRTNRFNGKVWCGRCERGKEMGAPAERLKALRRQATHWFLNTEGYEPDRPCPKCGNPLRDTEYSRTGGVYYVGIASNAPHCCYLRWEHIHRSCGRCTHKAVEVPPDFTPEMVT